MTKFLIICLGVSMLIAVPVRTPAAGKVAISFDKYHGYTATVDYLKAVSKSYASITDLVEIGKSAQGRPLYVLVITNKATGTTLDREKKLVYERKLEVPNPPLLSLDLGKPGHFVSGSIHGNEPTGTEVCLYFINQLLSGYGSDPQITSWIDSKVFYVCPVINPDGLYNSVELGAPQATNSMDQTAAAKTPLRKDLNGDGLFSQIRYPSPEGEWVKDSTDPRVMLKAASGEYPGEARYIVVNEAEADKGIDLNHNFPEGWWVGDVMPDVSPVYTDRMSGYRGDMKPAGSGEFAVSAPETHALCEFFITHPNIILANDYHTMGGFVYRPLGSTGDKRVQPRDLIVYDRIMGKKYLELLGSGLPPAWTSPDSIEEYRDALAAGRNEYVVARGYVFPYEWRSPYNERNEKGSHGLMMDWLYKQNGIYAVETHVWNPETDVPGLKGLKGAALQRALVAHAAASGGKLFLDWKPAKHPVYGEVEVGGWIGAVGGNNAFPGEILEKICARQWQYDFYRTTLMPQLQINDIQVKKKSEGGTVILEITAEIENAGALPTTLQRAETLPLNRGDVVWLIGENNRLTFLSGSACQKIGALGGTLELPETPDVKNRKTVKWLVSLQGNEKINVVASSLKGGTVVKQVKY
ncbi:MAG: hypothetical protein LBQ73_05610 [Tannerellaceae bacterium]|jgi:hypothetical protein|nr:hypothetical protein [Tannerellaceae bacterium]